MLKNRIIILFSALLFFLPCVMSEENTAVTETTSQQEVVSEGSEETVPTAVNQTQAEPSAVRETKSSPYKQPVSKRKLAKRFLKAMAGVAISSILLFVILSLYNKLRESYSTQETLLKNDSSLVTPDTLNKAVKAFLNKTR